MSTQSLQKLQQENQVLKEELEESNNGMLALSIELQKAEEKYRSIIERSSDAIMQIDISDRIEYINPAALIIFGFNTQEEMQKHFTHFNDLFEDSDEFTTCSKEVANGKSVHSIRLMSEDKNHKQLWVDCSLQPILDENRHVTGIDVILRDITDQKEAYEKIQLASKVFEHSIEGIVITDDKERILMTNPGFTNITGYTAEEVYMQTPQLLASGWHDDYFYKMVWKSINETGYWNGEIKDRKKDGEVYEQEATICAIKNDMGETTNYCAIISDISHRKQMEERVAKLAYFDSLTSLPNRFSFKQKLEQGLSNAARTSYSLALFFLDLDNFKLINDSLGHYFGDKLLQEVARRLLECSRQNDVVARLGGDEFTVFLEGIHNKEDAISVAEHMSVRLAEPYVIEGRTIYSSSSIGIAFYPQDAATYTDLIKCADTAMYQAKEEGKNQIKFFKPELNTKVQEYLLLETNLRNALKHQEFFLYYQPVINLQTGVISSAEGLLRWDSASMGFVSPDLFIPHAETSGLILEIGAWVLEEACKNIQYLSKKGYEDFTISINVSAKQIREKNFVKRVKSTMQRYGVNASQIALEVTESYLIEHMQDTLPNLQELKDFGITLLIDDFGTGYSSLGYLKMLPSQKVKVDRTFIKDILKDKDNLQITAAIIAMSHALDKHVVAEGVETKEQLDILQRFNCDEIQGYYFYKPMPISELLENLSKRVVP